MMNLTSARRSDRLTWMVAAIAIVAIALAVFLGLLYVKQANSAAKEKQDVACSRDAAARDRGALVQLETAQRNHLQHPGRQTAADVVADINHFLETVKADDPLRLGC